MIAPRLEKDDQGMGLGSVVRDAMVSALESRGYAVMRDYQLALQAHVLHLRNLLKLYRVDCVLDVGANRGQFRDFLRQDVGYTGPVMSFEPIRHLADELAARALQDVHWQVFPHALGSAESSAEINVARLDVFSSFLDARHDAVKDFVDENVVARRETVRIRTLDAVWQELEPAGRPSRIFLKMDTQGFDLEVLKGSATTLGSVSAIQTEASVLPVYDTMPTYSETIAAIGNLGFELSGMFPVNCDSSLRLVEFDCVFVQPARR